MKKSKKGSLKEKIEEELSRLISPNARFPFSKNPVKVRVIEVDEKAKEVRLHLGTCRAVEGMRLSQFLEKELEKSFPGIRVSSSFTGI